MIICMCKIICVTNRLLCKESLLSRMEMIAEAKPHALILREKDLDEKAYEALAREVIRICRRHDVLCILHYHYRVAKRLEHKAFHAPLHVIEEMSESEKKYFTVLGASCHSTKDAIKAEKLGCTYITAGHIFDTECKSGIPGRGANFLRDICKSVNVNVYAIGGISEKNISEVIKNGAAGACIMKSVMVSDDVCGLFKRLRENE